MADLKELYKEDGLQGIIPYAFGMKGSGYEFLCNRLKDGERYWILYATVTEMPFVFTENEKTYFSIYSSEENAERVALQMAAKGFHTTPILVDSKDKASEQLKRFRDLGADHLRMDDAIWINITDMVPAMNYDGFINRNVPIRNAELNAILYCTMQHLRSGMPCNSLLALLWEKMSRTKFYVPIKPDHKLHAGEALSGDMVMPHLLQLEEGSDQYGLAVFTDQDFMSYYVQMQELDKSDYTACLTPELFNLLEYMEESKHPFILNPYAGSFIFDEETVKELETIMLNQEAIKSIR